MIMMKKNLTAHKIAKIKGAKISLWTNSPKLRAAKIKGFTVSRLSDDARMVAMSGDSRPNQFANVPL